jgi:hypothetical protein
MQRSLELTALGDAARLALMPGATGYVEACFERATYLRTQSGVAAVTAPGTYLGPLHAVLSQPIPRITVATRVAVEAERIVIGMVTIRHASALRWSGRCPNAVDLLSHRAAMGSVIDDIAAGSPLLSRPYAAAIAGWEDALQLGDLRSVTRLLAGIGPGLTPSGDDSLAGVLLVTRILWGVRAEPALARCAGEARTSRLSRAFLSWAARGQLVAPVHDLLDALVRHDTEGVERCGRLVASVGASSGADTCLGISRALRLLPVGVAEPCDMEASAPPASAHQVGPRIK